MTSKDRDEFIQYLRQCTNQQVLGVLAKERAAGRHDYVVLALFEAGRRGLETR